MTIETTGNRKTGKVAAGTAALIAAQAMIGGTARAAQDAGGLIAASDVGDVVDVALNPDGSATLTLASGETVTVPASSVSVVDGVIMVDAGVVSDLIAEVSADAGGGLSPGLLKAALLSAVGVGLAIPAIADDNDTRDIPQPEVPDAGPIFQSMAAVSVAEGQSAVTTVEATDSDSMTVTYSITGGADADLFAIDADTGALTFIAPTDFEAPADAGADNVYDVIVTASDGVNTADQSLQVTVLNVNEGVQITSAAAASVDENETEAATVTAVDADGDAVTFSIVGGADAAQFTIDAATGVLTFVNAPDFENPADADGDNGYDVTVQASDGTLSVTQMLTVTVADENDNAPVFTSVDTDVDVLEEGETATGYVAAATDDDDGDVVTFAIGGADAASFTIDAATGALSFIAPPDFDDPQDADGDNVYDVVVTASDGENTATQDVTVTVQQSGVPIFVSDATVSAPENGTATNYTAAATDDDSPTLTFAIDGGADAAQFTIDAMTGVLTFNAAQDFETPGDDDGDNVYEVTVTATDGTNTASQDVEVTLTDEPDEAPVFVSDAAVSVAENMLSTGYVADATPDVDGDDVTYAITGGADASAFTIDAMTGALSFADRPDFEAPGDDGMDNVYDVTVTASDGTNSATQDVQVTVTDTTEIFELRGIANPDFAGIAVTSIGDVDGDGRDDVVVGAILADSDGRFQAGETYVVFSSTLAASATGLVDLATASNIGVRIGGAAAGDESGFSVSNAGDVDGDGTDDLLIGAHLADPNGDDAAGASYVVFGSTLAASQGGSVDLGALGGGGVVLNGFGVGSQNGFSVSSAGDVDGDGLADVIVGSPFAAPNGQPGAGQSFVVFGSELSTDTDGVIDLSALGTQGITINGIDQDDNAGATVSSAGDIDGDGLDDVIIGARFADPEGQDAAGETYIVFGSALSNDMDGVIDLATLGTDGLRIDGADAVDFSGFTVTNLGDLDGDGLSEVAIGAIIADPAGRENAGETYVVFGSTLAAETDGVLDLETLGTGGVVIGGDQAFDESGFALSNAGDVDGDGIDDLIVTARIADQSGLTDNGSAYVVFGSSILDDADGFIDLNADLGSSVVRIDGVETGGQLGTSASSAGDIDGDGLADIIIGAQFDDRPGGGGDAGSAYVISGALIAGEIGGDGIIQVDQGD